MAAMKKIILLLFISTAALYISSCEFGLEEEVVIPEINVTGQVIDKTSGNALSNASVMLIGGGETEIIRTNSEGKFTAVLQLEKDTKLTVIISLEGFVADTIQALAVPEQDLELPLIRLQKNEQAGTTSSGSPASIYLYDQSAKSIGVKESGSNETAQITFELLDSTGVSVSSDASVVVYFALLSSPGGGEYLSPASVRSNALGRASVTLNTGFKAGVAQVIAEANVNGLIIRSRPVLISIHGGFPDPGHFAVAAEHLNYPVLGIIGYPIPFTAFVGDKFSNPVRKGTSVYFETTSGIIAGSELTDDLGRSTVTLLTQPFPVHPEYGAGFFVVTASTVDENVAQIKTQTLRLLSGYPNITVNPGTIDIPNGGSQMFSYSVNDANGNPLAADNRITVKVVEGDIKVSGDVDIKMPDTQSRNYTQFSFMAFDAKPDTIKSQTAVISIESAGPNGDVKVSISGTAR